MNLRKRRRILQIFHKGTDYGTPFLPSMMEWQLQAGKKLTSDSIQVNGNRYAYSAGDGGEICNNLRGKTIVIDFDADHDDYYVQVGTKPNMTAGYGVSSVAGRITVTNKAARQGHYHAEVVVGEDFTPANWNHYFIVALFVRSTSPNTIFTNFKCGYK